MNNQNPTSLQFSRRIDRLSSSLIRELLALTEQEDMISFAGGLPSAELMPDISLEQVPQAYSQYGTTDGEKPLRSLIASRLTDHGLMADSDQVLITSGSQQGIDLVAKLFIDEDSPVIVEKPAYLAALQVFRLFGAELTGIDILPDGMCLDQLRRRLEKKKPAFIYVNPDFQNPTGFSYSEDKRIELASLLDKFDIPLVEDNPYGELCYEGQPKKPVASYLQKAPWVYLGSFSKVAVPAWRIGYMIADQRLLPWFVKLKQGTDLHTNRPGQWWCYEYLKNDIGYDRHIDILRSHYRRQRDTMENALQRYLINDAEWHRPGGGLFYWVKLRSIADTSALLAQALQQKVAFLPGSAFFPGDESHHSTIRLSFSDVSQEAIDQGIKRIATLIKDRAAN